MTLSLRLSESLRLRHLRVCFIEGTRAVLRIERELPRAPDAPVTVLFSARPVCGATA